MFLPLPPPPPATPDPPIPAPPIVLADVIDPAPGGDSLSFLGGADPIEAALQWQFTVHRGDGAALGSNGHALHQITKATPSAPQQLEDEVRRVCGKFVTRGQLDGLEVAVTVTELGTASADIQASATNVLADRATRLQLGGG